jgi:hypothetical protein
MARTNRLLFLACGAALLASVPGTRAPADEKAKPAKDIDRTPIDCVQAASISRKTAIDSKTILFSLKGNKFMRVDLPGACPSLTPGQTQLIFITEDSRTGSGKLARLCSHDSFGVEHRPGSGCQLAKFNPITPDEASQLLATAGVK